MSYKVIPIQQKAGFLSVNCYLIEQDDGFILIDTGFSKSRKQLLQAMHSLGLQPGDLKLIIITHGDVDHIGNCAYLKNRYCCQIAMHQDDELMATEGDMFYNRKNPLFPLRLLSNVLFPFNYKDRFSPDMHIKNGDNFLAYNFDAEVISIPGHSKGSVGILTKEGDLFCGDLLENIKKPQLATIIDNRSEASNSLDLLKSLNVKTIYPGHGKEFEMKDLWKNGTISKQR